MNGAPRAVPPAVNSWNAEYLEQQYHQYCQDPASVPDDLRSFFQGFDLAVATGRSDSPPSSGPPTGVTSTGGHGPIPADEVREALRLQFGITNLIDSYRRRGHIAAQTDPFGRPPERAASITLEYHNLTKDDLVKLVSPGRLPLPDPSPVKDIIDLLEVMYCGTIGAQFMHIANEAERDWFVERFERERGVPNLSRGKRAHILEQLIKAEQFEVFLQKRYPGEKRFSLEGGESLIACLDALIEKAAELEAEEVVIGMSHRGRLNVLNNILGKSYEQIFTEFEDNWEENFVDGGGDVKYHRGYSGERPLYGGKTIHLAMASNPSHLESVDAVVHGRTRAKQRLRGDTQRRRVMPLLVHGDAAVIGQGIVQETLNYSQLEGYTTGGTVHVVVNNLIGFTTGPSDARSSRYCTDIGMMVETPIFHVNGDDPEAVVRVAEIAAEFRQKFGRDVFIDLLCFRKHGHNEQDEPSFTQPVVAKLIKQKEGVLKTYAERLLSEGVISVPDMEVISQRLNDALERAQEAARSTPKDPTIDPGSARWSGYANNYSFEPVVTGIDASTLNEICGAMSRVPDGFALNPKLKKLLSERGEIPDAGKLNHADAELIALGSLLLDGHAVRLSGQDCRRGTFSQRHVVLRDYNTGDPYTPLNAMRPIAERPDDAGRPTADGTAPKQARFCIYDSPLSEEAVLGFEYGYSLADPRMLILWEAQFGDFNNGAQVLIDQYIASASLKWERWSGLVLLLPHGYEGAGPEHSSARLERFLQLCADDNMQVVYPSTAAQCFHMLRRQLKQPFRKPLIVMTPKSMLRIPTSSVSEILDGTHFRNVIDDPSFESSSAKKSSVRRVVLCSGKIYHELSARREQASEGNIAIVRVEQLYPLDTQSIAAILGTYPADAELVWVQEEPRNMGAYLFVADLLRDTLNIDRLGYIGRSASASPAVGSKSIHKEQQEAILARAIAPAPGWSGVSKAAAKTVRFSIFNPDVLRTSGSQNPCGTTDDVNPQKTADQPAASGQNNGGAAHRTAPANAQAGVSASSASSGSSKKAARSSKVAAD